MFDNSLRKPVPAWVSNAAIHVEPGCLRGYEFVMRSGGGRLRDAQMPGPGGTLIYVSERRRVGSIRRRNARFEPIVVTRYLQTVSA